MKRALIAALTSISVFAAVPTPQSVRAVDLRPSIRPLAWTSINVDMFTGEVSEPSVDNHCTAWALKRAGDPTTHWVTAGHCVLDEETGEQEDHDYQIDGHYLYVEAADKVHDLASLAGDYDVPSLVLAKNQGKVGDEIVVRGFPFGWSYLITTEGILSALDVKFPDEDEIYTIYNVTIAAGSSGSPVFDRQNHVIGLLQIGFSRGFGPMSGGARLSDLQTFVANLGE